MSTTLIYAYVASRRALAFEWPIGTGQVALMPVTHLRQAGWRVTDEDLQKLPRADGPAIQVAGAQTLRDPRVQAMNPERKNGLIRR